MKYKKSVKADNDNGDDLLSPVFWNKFVDDPFSSWSDFIKAEAALRESLSVKPLTVKTKYTHPDPSHWIKIVGLLYGIFYKDKTFINIRRDGRPFSVDFLKFSKRILLKFPVFLPERSILCYVNDNGGSMLDKN